VASGGYGDRKPAQKEQRKLELHNSSLLHGRK
jgi:hypothetical protein